MGVVVLVRQKRIKKEKQLGDLILTHNTQGVMMTDRALKITSVNKAFETITGYTEDEVTGHSPAMLSSGKHEKDFYKAMWQRINASGTWEGEVLNKRKNGELYPQWLNIVALKSTGNDIERYAATLFDLSPLKQAEDKIKQLAYYDSLTQLGNTYLLKENLDRLLTEAKSKNNQVGVLYIDIDHFKEINTSLGRRVGDDLLKAVATLLLKITPDNGLVTRHDSHRFFIVLPVPHSSFKKIDKFLTEFAEQINLLSTSPIHCAGHDIQTNYAIGIASFPKNSSDSETLQKHASIALEHAKKTQPSHVQFYNMTIGEQANHRYQLSQGISKAIERNELFLVFQPQLDRHGVVIAAEVLLRWQSTEFGLVSPDIFIPLAEERGDIIAIGHWVLLKTLEQMKVWKVAGLCGSGRIKRLAINVSSHQILSENTYTDFKMLCESSDISPESIELEITETGVMSFSEHIIDYLQKLQSDGFSIAIDDFGTGYSSLSRLHHFPINILKIDRSFTQQIIGDDSQAEIVQHIINMAHSLKMQVVVEGVETEAEYDMLMGFGCDIFQGYYFAKPLSADDFLTYVYKLSPPSRKE